MTIFSELLSKIVNPIPSPKVEGTSVTFGQAFTFSHQDKIGVHPSAAISSRGAFSDKVSALRSTIGAERKPFIAPAAPISKEPPPVSTSPTLPSMQLPICGQAPKEVAVRIVRSVESVETTPQGRIRTPPVARLAMAAANARAGTATVNLPFSRNVNSKTRRTPINLVGSTLNDVAKVAPVVEDVAVSVPSCVKSQLEIREALNEAQKADLSVVLKSRRSESLETNRLKVPGMQVNFNYNYFTEDEEDIQSQEKQSLDPLLKNRPIDVPRYVELRWNMVQVTEPITGTELEAQLYKEERNIFTKRRGVTGTTSTQFSDSVTSKKKIVQPSVVDGIARRVVDVHRPEVAFESISNRKVFSNSISAVLSSAAQRADVFSLPFQPKSSGRSAGKTKVEADTSSSRFPFLFPGVSKTAVKSPIPSIFQGFFGGN